MRVEPAAEALEFALGVRELLGAACDSAALRGAWDDDVGTSGGGGGRVPGLWKRLAEMGVAGLTAPEEFGGSGLDLTAVLPVLVETGRAAVPEPLVETLVGVELLRQAGGPVAQEWLPRVAEGSAVLAIGPGPRGLMSGAEHADLLLLADDAGAVHAVGRDAVAVAAETSVDKGMRLATVTWSPSESTRLVGADGLAAFDWAVVAVAAQLVGLAEAMLDMSVRYAGQREQFGKAIGSFQAVKHHLANVYVANSFAVPVVGRAAWSVTRDLPSRGRDASHAKHAATLAAQRAARTALQVHGGIGYTYEHDLHMWMKRTWTLSSLWGDAAFHLQRVASDVLADEPSPRVP